MKSCVGCGDDWKHRWTEADLGLMTIQGVDYDVCPDCWEECEELPVNDGPDRTDPGYWKDNF